MPSTPRKFLRALLAVLVAAGLTGFGAAASAHTELVFSTPKDGDVLSSLPTVRLEFTEALLTIGNSITVTDATGATTALTLTYPKPQAIEATVPTLPPGAVTIHFRVVASDGHSLEGKIGVTLTGDSSPGTSPSSTTSSPGATSAVAAPSPTPRVLGAAPGGEQGESHGPLVLALLGLLLLGGAGAAWVFARRTRPGSPPR